MRPGERIADGLAAAFACDQGGLSSGRLGVPQGGRGGPGSGSECGGWRVMDSTVVVPDCGVCRPPGCSLMRSPRSVTGLRIDRSHFIGFGRRCSSPISMAPRAARIRWSVRGRSVGMVSAPARLAVGDEVRFGGGVHVRRALSGCRVVLVDVVGAALLGSTGFGVAGRAPLPARGVLEGLPANVCRAGPLVGGPHCRGLHGTPPGAGPGMFAGAGRCKLPAATYLSTMD